MALRTVELLFHGNASQAAAEIERLSATTGAASASMGEKFAAFGKKVAIVGGLAAVAIGTASVKMAGDFQEGITKLETGAGELHKNLKTVSDGILSLAVSTGTTTKQLTDGMFMIESAGYHGAAGLQVLKVAAEGARVGNSDLGTTANAVTTVMNDYHLKAGQAADATNFLVAVVKQGKTHMEDLAGAISQVLPVASALHVPLSDVGGAMATLTAHGVDANRAATSLRFSINSLIAPSAKASNAMNEIGLSASDVSNTLSKKGLVAAMQLIEDHLKTKFPQGGAAATAALSDMMGGVRGMGAALGLTGDNLQEFIDKTKKTSDAISGAHGKVIGWAATQKDFNFKLDQAREVVQTLGIKIGLVLIPILTSVATAVSHVVDWFEKHRVAAIALGAIIGTFLVAAVAAYTVAMISAAAATIAATWPILAIIVAVGALVVGIVYLWTHWNEIWNFIKSHPAYAAIIAVIGSIVTGGILPLVFGAVWLAKNWDQVWSTIQSITSTVWGVLSAIFNAVVGALSGVIATAQFMWSAWSFVWNAASALASVAASIVGAAMGVISGAVNAVVGAVQFLQGIWSSVMGALGAIAGGAAGAVEGALGGILSILSDIIGTARSAANALSDIASHVPGAGIVSGIGGLLGFAEGGPVPGPPGAPRLAVVHGGEFVVPAGGALISSGGGGGVGGGTTVNVYVAGSVLSERDLVDVVVANVNRTGGPKISSRAIV